MDFQRAFLEISWELDGRLGDHRSNSNMELSAIGMDSDHEPHPAAIFQSNKGTHDAMGKTTNYCADSNAYAAMPEKQDSSVWCDQASSSVLYLGDSQEYANLLEANDPTNGEMLFYKVQAPLFLLPDYEYLFVLWGRAPWWNYLKNVWIKMTGQPAPQHKY